MIFGIGDLVSIGTAVVFACMIRRSDRTPDRIALFLANGLSFGTMLLVLLSPLFQILGSGTNLLEIAVREEKVVLWWAAAIAAVNLIWTLL